MIQGLGFKGRVNRLFGVTPTVPRRHLLALEDQLEDRQGHINTSARKRRDLEAVNLVGKWHFPTEVK